MRLVHIGRRTCVYIMLHGTHTFTQFNLFMYCRVQGSCYHCYNSSLQTLNLRVCRSMTRLFDRRIAVLITVGCTFNAFRTSLLKCKHVHILRIASFHSFRYLVTWVSLQLSAFVCFNWRRQIPRARQSVILRSSSYEYIYLLSIEQPQSRGPTASTPTPSMGGTKIQSWSTDRLSRLLF